MIEIVSAVIGFAAPFLPEVLKYYNRKQDNTHELAMLEKQADLAKNQHLWKMEEVETAANKAIEAVETSEIYKPQASFGIQLLDAAKSNGLSGWALYPAFYLFCLLDFVSGLVRPSITYASFAFYMAVKWAELSIAKTHNTSLSAAILQIWTQDDRAIVILILSYWFGLRSAKAAFGGSAMTINKS